MLHVGVSTSHYRSHRPPLIANVGLQEATLDPFRAAPGRIETVMPPRPQSTGFYLSRYPKPAVQIAVSNGMDAPTLNGIKRAKVEVSPAT
jgi:hypothetical protein